MLQTGSLSSILHQKTTAGVSLPWFFILSCKKVSHFEVLRSFEQKIFVCRAKKYWMYFEAEKFSADRKIPSKPCKSLSETA